MAVTATQEAYFKILIATDLHLGYKELDDVRSEDSFIAFEEILDKANSLNVDFLLLGGDIFHETKPSRLTYFKSMQLLKNYVVGEKQHLFSVKNFENCNINKPKHLIQLPIFTIHGNHDDPIGEGNLSSIDLLNTPDFLNYFGRVQSYDILVIEPILIEKGKTVIALYGLGYIKDDFLFRKFKEGKVKFKDPEPH